MALDPRKLLAYDIPATEQTLTTRDTILYALGVGLGHDPCDPHQLKFVYEKELVALPTMAIILGYPGPWHVDANGGVTRSHVVHGEQGFRIHRPLPVEGVITGKTKLTHVIDKGEGKGALLYTETEVREKKSNDLLCTLASTTFCRADGGFGGDTGPVKPSHPIPDRKPDHVCDLETRPEAALIYRLSGDYNPLHAEPDYAKKAGYPKPILHGRATFSVVGHALVKALCAYDPARLKSMDGRFSSPVFPGETIRTEMWMDGKVASFRATVPARSVTVLANGRAEVSG
ncbi:MAG: MaoC/PaaZ C-terminal domain-containing protein [Burkholderiales bacterium]